MVLRSLLGLLALTLEIAGQQRTGRVLHRLLRPRDSLLAVTTVAAMAASVAAYVYFLHRGVSLRLPRRGMAFPDRPAGDRFPDGRRRPAGCRLAAAAASAGAAVHLGERLYLGFAGSLISMIAYVMTVRYAYMIAAGLTGTRGRAVSWRPLLYRHEPQRALPAEPGTVLPRAQPR